MPWFKSENFDQFYLRSRVSELHGILSTIGYPVARDAFTNTAAVAMIGVKGGAPLVGPSESKLTHRAEPLYAADSMSSRWHTLHKWRHDNVQPHPSKFPSDLGLAEIKKLDAAIGTYLWSADSTASAYAKGHLSDFDRHLTQALGKFELQPITKCPTKHRAPPQIEQA